MLTEEEFQKLGEDSSYDLEGEKEKKKDLFKEVYYNILDILKEYIDIKPEYYNIIALWIMGTYFHDNFPSYPFLFFNAMKGSGKSRTLALISVLAKDGSVQNSLTEAVLFRTQGTLAIDEYEGISKKGSENLRELLNSAYKKGTKVRRMKQKKTDKGTDQVVEEFDVYRPIVLANIWGMENVLGDRCITLILEKSSDQKKTNLVEIFREELIVKRTIELLKECSLCRCSFSGETYMNWNYYVNSNYTNYINYINNTNYINYTQLFKSIKSMDLNGRELELSFPLCLIANEISSVVLKETTLTLRTIFLDKRSEELIENYDISLIDFLSQITFTHYISINELTRQFKEFLNTHDEWINSKWMGRALKRLDMVKEKRRKSYGVEVIINVEKAQDKIKMFK